MNQIHPTAIVGKNVVLGDNNEILPYTVLDGPLEIGNGNRIGPHVVIGSPGQDTRNPRYECSQKKIKIGNNNIIREFTAVQKPAYKDITQIGNDVFLMQSVHIPHDAVLEDKVVITPMVALAGIVRLLEGCNIGMGASIHQYSIIGQYSIVATGAAVLKNVKPFSRFIPGKPTSVNQYAVTKFGYSEFTDEISKYVLEDRMPSSERVLAIVEHYLKFHRQSERPQY
jgi:UDP-N-acetylglucosamine acyltransferase